MTYNYRVVWAGTVDRIIRGGEQEHNEYKNQPCSWCKTSASAAANFTKNIRSLENSGAVVKITEYNIEFKPC